MKTAVSPHPAKLRRNEMQRLRRRAGLLLDSPLGSAVSGHLKQTPGLRRSKRKVSTKEECEKRAREFQQDIENYVWPGHDKWEALKVKNMKLKGRARAVYTRRSFEAGEFIADYAYDAEGRDGSLVSEKEGECRDLFPWQLYRCNT